MYSCAVVVPRCRRGGGASRLMRLALQRLAKEILKAADKDHDGQISIEEFKVYCKKHPELYATQPVTCTVLYPTATYAPTRLTELNQLRDLLCHVLGEEMRPKEKSPKIPHALMQPPAAASTKESPKVPHHKVIAGHFLLAFFLLRPFFFCTSHVLITHSQLTCYPHRTHPHRPIPLALLLRLLSQLHLRQRNLPRYPRRYGLPTLTMLSVYLSLPCSFSATVAEREVTSHRSK